MREKCDLGVLSLSSTPPDTAPPPRDRALVMEVLSFVRVLREDRAPENLKLLTFLETLVPL